MATTKRETRLIIRLKDENSFNDPYLHLTTEVVYFDNEDQHWVNCYGYSTPDPLKGFEKLGVHAQADKYTSKLYGASVAYHDVYRAELDKVQLMAKTIAAVDRRMGKLREAFGYERTADQVVARFARAVPCTGTRVFGFYDKTSPMQDNHGYVWVDADGLKYRIEKRQDEFAAKYNIQPRED